MTQELMRIEIILESAVDDFFRPLGKSALENNFRRYQTLQEFSR